MMNVLSNFEKNEVDFVVIMVISFVCVVEFCVNGNDLVVIEIKEFMKKYGEFMVLDIFFLSVVKGKIFGLIGFNGVGKMICIKILVGFV